MPSVGAANSRDTAAPSHWRIGPGRHLMLDQPVFMGILNVTPDSFSDGGQFDDVAQAMVRASQLIEDGTQIIDVGGESTRPGAKRIDAQIQIDRILPVVEAIAAESDVIISIDTTRANVARAALEGGASIINDVSAGEEDEELLALAAERDCGIVLMHRLRPPTEDSFSHQYADAPRYGDVVSDVRGYLLDRTKAAIAAGVSRENIVIDPGLGFGKTVEQNYELIARGGEFVETGFLVLSAASRKSFIGVAAGIDDPAARDAASASVTIRHHAQGVRLFRVHDVRAHRQALAVTHAIDRASKNRSGSENCG